MRTKIAFLVLLLALTSCSTYRLVEPTRQDIAGRYSVATPVEWTGATVTNGEYWTINGAVLDELNFFAGIKPGDPLVNAYGSDAEPPAFKASMRASEVMELVTDSLAFQGYRKVRGSKLRPAEFGALPGFRFELVFTTEDGLNYAGKAIGAIANDELHLILFSAPFSHYFPAYHQTVEQIFNSIDLAAESG